MMGVFLTSTLMASLLLAGCDSSHPPFSSVALGGADFDVSLVDNAPLDSTAGASPAGSTTLGGPLAGLDADQLADFIEGKDEFEEEETIEQGLGPVFNEAACVTCHTAPTGGTNGRLETRFGRRDNGRFDPLARFGGSLLQDHAIGAVNTEHGAFTYVPEVVPRAANVKALRLTTPLFGLGLVDAVSDAALIALARYQARNWPGTRGTAHMVTDAGGMVRVGRFGWKAQVATLHTFSGDAYLNEMGITSPDFPNENAPQGNVDALAFNPMPELNDDGEGIEAFTNFMTLIGPPPRGARTRSVEAGSTVFKKTGCANCHNPTLITGDSPVLAIAHKVFQPYSDFLLHDMGPLGDGIAQGQAGGRMMRTAPLWGLSARPLFMHDGRAKTIEAAILAHAGQGTDARSRYLRLGSNDRFTLRQFLKSL